MLLCRNGRFFSRFLLFVQIMMLITETNLYKSMAEKPWKPFNIITHNLLCIIMIMLLFLMFHKMIKSMPYPPVSTSNPLDSTQSLMHLANLRSLSNHTFTRNHWFVRRTEWVIEAKEELDFSAICSGGVFSVFRGGFSWYQLCWSDGGEHFIYFLGD